MAGSALTSAFPFATAPVRLPVRFRAVPVWDLSSPADKEIRLFPASQTAGGPVHPIDAGHYYLTPGPSYAGTDLEAIYAHEYGHLLGLSDEYSHSNPQMHALLHGIDPGTSAQRGAAMNRETVRRMVMAALARPLVTRVGAVTTEISAAFLAAQAPISSALGASLRSALASAGVQQLFAAQATPGLALDPATVRRVRAATRAPANSTAVARAVVAAELAAAPIDALVRRLYQGVLSRAMTAPTDVGGISMTITVEGASGIDSDGNVVGAATGLWSGAGAPAAAIGPAVDQAAGGARTGRLPAIDPSGSILRQILALPSGWAALSAAAPASLAAGTLESDLTAALRNAWVARMLSLGTAPPPATVGTIVRNAATSAAQNAMRAFLTAELQPILNNGTTALQSAIAEEVTRIMGTPAEKLAQTSAPDPALQALAEAMWRRMQASRVSSIVNQLVSGRPAVNPGTTAPAQEVTYSTVNMMSSNDDIFRPDQFAEIATAFNSSSLRHLYESDFRIVMGRT